MLGMQSYLSPPTPRGERKSSFLHQVRRRSTRKDKALADARRVVHAQSPRNYRQTWPSHTSFLFPPPAVLSRCPHFQLFAPPGRR